MHLRRSRCMTDYEIGSQSDSFVIIAECGIRTPVGKVHFIKKDHAHDKGDKIYCKDVHLVTH